MTTVIEVQHMRKRYGDTVAVDDVSFTVEEGEIFGILGPNGAGKTTTVECIEGLRKPDGGAVSVIDFDDSGFSWFLYDVGTSVSFFVHQPHVPDLVASWLAGYRRVLSLPAEDQAEIWTFIMFRRLLLVAWIGSHQGADIAQQLGAGYTQDSCDLAERFLSRGGKE